MRSHPLLISALGLSALLLVGCHSSPLHSTGIGYSLRDVAPLYDDFGQARSLVLTTPVVRSAQRPQPDYSPWYAARRDFGPFVTAGYVSPEYSSSVTYTRDRQSTFNGRVYDNYNETTYRRTIQNSIR